MINENRFWTRIRVMHSVDKELRPALLTGYVWALRALDIDGPMSDGVFDDSVEDEDFIQAAELLLALSLDPPPRHPERAAADAAASA